MTGVQTCALPISKGVDYSAFKAINDACLVYDGHLVIDSTFHTNDCSIRAAGPLTKFARRYHADQWSHSHFSSREVGQELAGALLPLFDPTLEPATNPPGDLDRQPLSMSTSSVIFCINFLLV